MKNPIYELGWNRSSFIAKCRLLYESYRKHGALIHSLDKKTQAASYSALSSNCYSIFGTAFAQLRNIFKPKWYWLVILSPLRWLLWFVTWLPLGAWCYVRMFSFSDRVVEILGYEGMNAGQCDIRQSVLRKSIFHRRRKLSEALQCIRAGLEKYPLPAYTRGLLLIGFADIHSGAKKKHISISNISVAVQQADASADTAPRQAARIYRHAAELLTRLRYDQQKIRELRAKAEALIDATGAEDQRVKLG